ncbi:hypothetical protein KC345_g307 [Hortaea werneckii]|nr:hypothetical protein KC345_g307 [Hortaea werneckii]
MGALRSMSSVLLLLGGPGRSSACRIRSDCIGCETVGCTSGTCITVLALSTPIASTCPYYAKNGFTSSSACIAGEGAGDCAQGDGGHHSSTGRTSWASGLSVENISAYECSMMEAVEAAFDQSLRPTCPQHELPYGSSPADVKAASAPHRCQMLPARYQHMSDGLPVAAVDALDAASASGSRGTPESNNGPVRYELLSTVHAESRSLTPGHIFDICRIQRHDQDQALSSVKEPSRKDSVSETEGLQLARSRIVFANISRANRRRKTCEGLVKARRPRSWYSVDSVDCVLTVDKGRPVVSVGLANAAVRDGDTTGLAADAFSSELGELLLPLGPREISGRPDLSRPAKPASPPLTWLAPPASATVAVPGFLLPGFLLVPFFRSLACRLRGLHRALSLLPCCPPSRRFQQGCEYMIMLRVWVEAGATSAAAHPEAFGFDSSRFGGQTVLVPENLEIHTTGERLRECSGEAARRTNPVDNGNSPCAPVLSPCVRQKAYCEHWHGRLAAWILTTTRPITYCTLYRQLSRDTYHILLITAQKETITAGSLQCPFSVLPGLLTLLAYGYRKYRAADSKLHEADTRAMAILNTRNDLWLQLSHRAIVRCVSHQSATNHHNYDRTCACVLLACTLLPPAIAAPPSFVVSGGFKAAVLSALIRVRSEDLEHVERFVLHHPTVVLQLPHDQLQFDRLPLRDIGFRFYQNIVVAVEEKIESKKDQNTPWPELVGSSYSITAATARTIISGCLLSTSFNASGSGEVLPGFLNRKTLLMIVWVSLRASNGRRKIFSTRRDPEQIAVGFDQTRTPLRPERSTALLSRFSIQNDNSVRDGVTKGHRKTHNLIKWIHLPGSD